MPFIYKKLLNVLIVKYGFKMHRVIHIRASELMSGQGMILKYSPVWQVDKKVNLIPCLQGGWARYKKKLGTSTYKSKNDYS